MHLFFHNKYTGILFTLIVDHIHQHAVYGKSGSKMLSTRLVPELSSIRTKPGNSQSVPFNNTMENTEVYILPGYIVITI